MADEGKKNPTGKRIAEDQRMHYIGFEVFPGKPKDLFKTKAEQQRYVDGVVKKRASGDILRDHCTLMETRVSGLERVVLTIASLVMIAALFLPWYTAYQEVVEEVAVQEQAPADSTLLAETGADSLALAAVGGEVVSGDTPADATTGTEVPVAAEPADEAVAAAEPEAQQGVRTHQGARSKEEILTGHQFRKKVKKEYTRVTGIGTFGVLGLAGGHVFSSGFVLMISGLLMLLFIVLTVGLPVLNLYSLYGIKGKGDDVAMKLKKYLRLNWLPLILFVVVVFLSFIGADYGSWFQAGEGVFSSFGQVYGTGVLLDTLSWGIFVVIASSVLVAVKAIEI
ncbi:MAG: hypothetical protein KKA42_16175 [candidate division Zixibacteria bacterium]|nr:hypothetical protein [candidate division Zixibacteria bacterium]